MILKKSPKTFEGYKAESPENTIANVVAGFKKIGMDIRYFDNINTANEVGIFSGFAQLHHTPYATNGKGLTSILSKASAYAESVERFSAGSQFAFYVLEDYLFKNNLIFRNYTDNEIIKDFLNYTYMPGYIKSDNGQLENAVNIKDFLTRFSTAEEVLSNINTKDLHKHWCDGFSLLDNKTYKIPIRFVNYIQIHNGLASGNTYEEAIVHGCCEVFERYRALQVLKNKENVPTINIDSIEDERILSIVNILKTHNIEVIIKDLTKNNQFPVMGVLFINNNIKGDTNPVKKDFWHYRFRVASDLDLNIAVLRCFTEELQGYTLEEYIKQEEFDVLWEQWDKMGKTYTKSEKTEFKHYLRQSITNMDLSFLEENCADKDFSELLSINNDDFLDDIEDIMVICEKLDAKIYIVDHTHKTIDFPTIRVIIPSMSDVLDYYVNDDNELPEYFNNDKLLDFFYFEGLSQIVLDTKYRNEKEKVSEFIEKAESHLSKFMYDYNLALSRYGLMNLNLFSVMSQAYAAVGDDKSMNDYIELALNLWIYKTKAHDNQEFEKKKDEIRKSLAVPISKNNPFVNMCECKHCVEDHPRFMYHMIKSFY